MFSTLEFKLSSRGTSPAGIILYCVIFLDTTLYTQVEIRSLNFMPLKLAIAANLIGHWGLTRLSNIIETNQSDHDNSADNIKSRPTCIPYQRRN